MVAWLSMAVDMESEYMAWCERMGMVGVELPERYEYRGKEYRLERPGYVLVSGMGGSGIVGDIVRDTYALEGCDVEVNVVKDYHVGPARADLAIAVSYSGNTEETVIAALEALDRGIPTIAVTSGGTLSRIGVPVIQVPRAAAPRLALAQMYAAVMGILGKLGACELDVERACKCLSMDEELVGRLEGLFAGGPIAVLAPTPLRGTALRVKTELNENAKRLAYVEVLPEAHHNFITAVEGERPARALLLDHSRLPEEYRARLDITEELLVGAGVEVLRVDLSRCGYVPGDILGFLANVGIATVRLARRLGVDPFSIRNIDRVKEHMDRVGILKRRIPQLG